MKKPVGRHINEYHRFCSTPGRLLISSTCFTDQGIDNSKKWTKAVSIQPVRSFDFGLLECSVPDHFQFSTEWSPFKFNKAKLETFGFLDLVCQSVHFLLLFLLLLLLESPSTWKIVLFGNWVNRIYSQAYSKEGDRQKLSWKVWRIMDLHGFEGITLPKQ
jgi:hypothetical protein